MPGLPGYRQIIDGNAEEKSGMNIPAKTAPLYQRVKDYILSRIDSGEWKEFARVPSENQLVRQFNISRMTANRALRELTAEGYLVRVTGVGTFVAAKKAQSHLLEIHNIAEEVQLRGHSYSAHVVFNRVEKINADIADRMELTKGSGVFHSVIVHKEQEIPIQLESRYVNRKIAPGYGRLDFSKTTPAAYLLKVAPLQEVEHIVQAVMPDKRTATLLELAEHEPCLLVRRRTWTDGVVASYARLYHAGSRYELSGRLRF